ncbi:MAG: hypothetical protein RL693_1693, partial [Verrucomicrobiota bacterium]
MNSMIHRFKAPVTLFTMAVFAINTVQANPRINRSVNV